MSGIGNRQVEVVPGTGNNQDGRMPGIENRMRECLALKTDRIILKN